MDFDSIFVRSEQMVLDNDLQIKRGERRTGSASGNASRRDMSAVITTMGTFEPFSPVCPINRCQPSPISHAARRNVYFERRAHGAVAGSREGFNHEPYQCLTAQLTATDNPSFEPVGRHNLRCGLEHVHCVERQHEEWIGLIIVAVRGQVAASSVRIGSLSIF
ncbi:hypothetical protein [Bradyrhizobium sp. ORS 111]|uniref:hypothetical protein n=1 Tax=Bradyrhizobium sp. ORS 111 TaxID=1685958 RepID=UPI0038903B47